MRWKERLKELKRKRIARLLERLKRYERTWEERPVTLTGAVGQPRTQKAYYVIVEFGVPNPSPPPPCMIEQRSFVLCGRFPEWYARERVLEEVTRKIMLEYPYARNCLSLHPPKIVDFEVHEVSKKLYG